MTELPEATITSGKVRGAWRDGVAVFHGIEYATAERLKPPGLVKAWRGVREASVRGPVAPQLESRFDGYIGKVQPIPVGEDCLRASVFTPGLEGKRPVMLFLHGGAYVTGSGEDHRYGGGRLARDGGVVVINISYRLGALGYLHVPAMGILNLGLEDQWAGLRWVKANAAAFGGDPENITLFGQSAGAHAIAAMLAGGAQSLVKRAILQSPPLGSPITEEGADKVSGNFLLGLRQAVETAPVSAILSAQAATLEAVGGGMVFGPVVAGFGPPGRAEGLQILAGWTLDDAAPFVGRMGEDADAMTERVFGARRGCSRRTGRRRGLRRISTASAGGPRVRRWGRGIAWNWPCCWARLRIGLTRRCWATPRQGRWRRWAISCAWPGRLSRGEEPRHKLPPGWSGSNTA
ncbi:MAG: carboxylesterase family protein [Caulobacteraceae bacterium]